MFEYFKTITETITETVTQNGATLIELYKKDLNEFAAAVSTELQLPSSDQQQDHSSAHSSSLTTTTTTTTLSEILHNEQSYLQPIYLTDENDLNTIQIDVNSDQVTKDITSLLENDSILKDIHTKLVPSQISYPLFWKRYFQLKNNFEEFEKKRKLFESLKEETNKSTTTREEFYLNVLNEILESDDFKTVQDVKEFIKAQLAGINDDDSGQSGVQSGVHGGGHSGGQSGGGTRHGHGGTVLMDSKSGDASGIVESNLSQTTSDLNTTNSNTNVMTEEEDEEDWE
ncbi:hypothetical protein FDP41_007881 [Naegleria fowleri]|uniref:BSD domain-containing protein n=1 Tax=Naegleria fowleri TaxID=5763 RepID=A0A6A5C881_NAEFO|nr:uncharacterized protein FDP41_007881 [Naegleria fowleri]KAF0983966.1 hypothetical protein FDP41_007881 [Naegleria fowleri]